MYDFTAISYVGEFEKSFRQIFSPDLELEKKNIKTKTSI